MGFDVIQTNLSADLATSGTFTVGYPANRTAGSYNKGFQHRLFAGGKLRSNPADFTVVFTSNSVITVTYLGTTTIPANTRIELQLQRIGQDSWRTPAAQGVINEFHMDLVRVDLGSPAAGAANNLSVSASVTAIGTGAVLLTLAAAFDVPRTVNAAWTGTSVLTLTGKDVYGVTMTEASASGTSHTGKKAFKSISSATFSADVTAATIGCGNILGLPVFLPGTGFVLKELQDGAAPTAGTVVAGVVTAPSTTTGDVRGTYAPNATPDGAKDFALILALNDTSERGLTQV